MKNWILMVMFALFSMFAVACVSSDDSTTDDSTIQEPGDPGDPSTSTTESDVTLSCAGRCTQQYNVCISDGVSQCECNNARVVCRRACGFPGLLQACWE